MVSAEFNQAAEDVKTLKAASNDTKLKLYALFKQAQNGDVDTSRPGAFDFTGKAKWDAWDAIKGKSKEDAEAEYIALVKELLAAEK